MAAAMEQSNGGGGVKVKFIETQFVSSDAANFKSVVQRLTGKYSKMPPPASSVHRPRPRPCGRPDQQGRPCVSGSDELMMAAPAKPAAAAFEPLRVEEVNELCDFADLLYAAPSARRHGGSVVNGFPY
ncbi:hypothetical protein CFC21_103454 [Triticum aestivum]|uniref:VQ domain-containing protein n=3 Tax=Triticum TaxID=4564 RepID=A0A9R1A5T0_TRITD|nr:uncharacterized protein LOC119340034 [Triticum dicoccoides]KAF7102297.1 hypothetical protein CFC21_103454 [Triticum aestivum]VAI88854.1 unnamed protein product [Triticum turgidum subsp. durum]